MAPTPVPDTTLLKPDIHTLGKLMPYLWPHNLPKIRARVICSFVALVIAKGATLLVPLLFKDAIDSLSPLHQGMVMLPVVLILSYGVARFVSALFAEIRDGIFAAVAQRAIRQVGLSIFDHLHKLGLRFHLERQTGGLSRAIERGTKGIESLLYFLTFSIIPTLVEILLVAVALWILYDYRFSLITSATMVAYIAFTLFVTEWRIGFVRTMNATDSEAHTKAIDSLLNFETVKYFGNESHEASRFDSALKRYEAAAIKSKLSLSFLNMGQALIISTGLVAVMLMAGDAVTATKMTIGDFAAINTYLLQLYIPLFNLGFAYREVKLSLVSMEAMFDLLTIPEEIQDKPDAPPLKVSGGEIVFDHVSFSYGPDRPILKDISFHLPAGKTIAIVGASGAGKSTIGRLLFRFYDATHGRITIDGQDIRTVTQESLRQAIGVVPQDTVLFNDTIEYNIAYGKPDATLAQIEDAARQAHIHTFIMDLPQKYQSRVGERGLKLSGGEKQRVAIARTLLKKPHIFLFDEATSALDTHTEKQIHANLQEVSANHSTVIIAHRLSTVIEADEILVLDQGQIVERGKHSDLLAKNGLYAAMWQRQQENMGSASPFDEPSV
ncbi:MAG: putative multidrug export ATP-binding/permease protein [Alphaproteobacteria bacterium]|jgi:ATP-binding cassette subfamily B protein|nr:putative multidrug export ATP-binding/permease protein [Alphaproteobacteria bacterium]